MMSEKVIELMSKAFKSNEQALQDYEMMAERKPEAFIHDCFNNTKNIDAFGDCLKKKKDRLEQIKTEFPFRMQYFVIVGSECLAAGTSASECQDNASKGISQMIKATRTQIDQL